MLGGVAWCWSAVGGWWWVCWWVVAVVLGVLVGCGSGGGGSGVVSWVVSWVVGWCASVHAFHGRGKRTRRPNPCVALWTNSRESLRGNDWETVRGEGGGFCAQADRCFPPLYGRSRSLADHLQLIQVEMTGNAHSGVSGLLAFPNFPAVSAASSWRCVRYVHNSGPRLADCRKYSVPGLAISC